METLFLVVRILSHLAPVPLLIIGLRHRHLLGWYALAGLVSDLLMLALGFAHLPDKPVGNAFLVAEFLLLSIYFARALHFPRTAQWPLMGTALLFIIHTVANSINKLNLLGAAVLCIFYLGYTLASYHQLLKAAPEISSERSELFGVSTGVLFYAAATCLFFLFYATVLNKTQTGRYFWTIFFLMANVTKYLFLAAAVASRYSRRWSKPA